MNYKLLLRNYFHYFNYFYGFLKQRVILALFISLAVGILDGVGLALFIPLLQLAIGAESSGSLARNENFISEFIIETMNINPTLLNVFWLIFLFFTLKGIAKFSETYCRILYQQVFMRKLRVSNIDYLNTFDYKSFLKADTGKIQNTFSGEVNRVNIAYEFYFKSIQYGVLVFVYVIMAMGSDWKFTVLVVTGGGIMNLLFKSLYKKLKNFSRIFTAQSHLFQNLLVQKVHLFKYLKATGLNISYGSKLKRSIADMEGTQRKIGFVTALLGALREPLIILVVFSSIFLNFQLFDTSMGGVLLSLILLYRGISFFIAMQEQYNLFLSHAGSLENMETFSKELASNVEKSGGRSFTGLQKSLELKNLSFGFEKGQTVLRNISLDIYKNETIAIVGESGSGKSTLLNIMSGLLKPVSGKYLVDDKDINDIDLQEFKKYIGYIVQDPVIFNDTIFNNVSFWAPKNELNFHKFQTAMKKAAITDFLNKLPEKEDTKLGTDGVNISGGQKQRLSLARELYKEADILFMDEATSSLDGNTEAEIQNNMNRLKGQFTILTIAHRLTTVKNADRIVLLKDGSISAVGTFAELIENSPQFRKMVKHENLYIPN
ncbi:ABC transporter ATP-binding protein [uncultured Christiangramia sp.]|uniref:ABC transporter ATP-binding protein n=1 Tax=uncultured Christiangramia sp. TaxID=503836 RepID=UPI00260E495B|nr:ABC transporter ATP-binding protein [uncultured Christiangramia sp.]